MRVGLLAFIFVICLMLWGSKAWQPKYQGKTAEEWFEGVTTSSSGLEYLTKDPAVVGLRHLGTNAVWFLWKERAQKNSALLSPLRRQWEHFTRDPAHAPALANTETAWYILFVFGPETEILIPEALELLKSGKPQEAEKAVLLLGFTKRQPEVVVPAILQSMAWTYGNIDYRIKHIVALREMGPQAKAALPALRIHLKDPTVASTYEGDWTAEAILSISGPGPELGRFTNQVILGNYTQSAGAIHYLGKLGTNARPAAPLLWQLSQSLTNSTHAEHVLEAIGKIDPEGVYTRP